MPKLSSLRDLGYQLALVWFEIQKTHSWDIAIGYVDSLLAEAERESRGVLASKGVMEEQGQIYAEQFVTETAMIATNEVESALTTEANVIRELAAYHDHNPKPLRRYVELRLAFDTHPKWAQVLRHNGAITYTGDPDRPYHWHWSAGELAGFKPYLGMTWEEFAALFYRNGRPVKPEIRMNPDVSWRYKHSPSDTKHAKRLKIIEKIGF